MGCGERHYPHMCRDGHQEIGHSDSRTDEQCPVCRAQNELNVLKRDVLAIAQYRPMSATTRTMLFKLAGSPETVEGDA
jgi:hypothetical protein